MRSARSIGTSSTKTVPLRSTRPPATSTLNHHVQGDLRHADDALFWSTQGRRLDRR